MVKKYSDLYLDARKALLPGEGQQRAGLLARELLCAASGKSQEEILSRRDQYAPEEVCRTMEDFTGRALAGEPLAYILEEWDFYGMTLYVNRDVLIPRDDTCAVTELALKKALFLEQDPRILDLCTGSGCIGLAIARKVKDARVTLADVSREALVVAKKNAAAMKLTGRVSCIQAMPIIASGGAGKKEDFLELFHHKGIDAGLAAGIFHQKLLTIRDLKEYLAENGVEMRL